MSSSNKASKVRIALADDHNVVRKGLATLLALEGGYEITAEASNGEELLQLINGNPPDLIILDLSMPRLNGLETLRRIKRQMPETRTIILSMYHDETLITKAFSIGADGYILKDSMDDELFEALEEVLAGNQYISPVIDKSLLDRQPSEVGIDLTSREHEVLQLIAAGKTASEIANIMSISPHTANRHRANLMQKMGVRNQVELVRLAIERGLVIIGQNPFSADS